MAWGFLVQLGITAGLLIYSWMTRQRPEQERAKRPTLGDINLPRAEEGVPVPLFFGRCRTKTPHVIWYGNLDPREYGGGAGFLHYYTVDFCLGIPMGSDNNPPTHLYKIWSDEQEVWSGDVDDWLDVVTVGSYVNDPGFPSGGRVVFYPGWLQGAAAPQPADPWIYQHFTDDAGLDETLLPAYHGYARAVFRGDVAYDGFNWGRDPSPAPPSFEIGAVDNPLSLGAIGNDANPAEVIYWLLTGGLGCLGIDTSLVDSTSFTSAGTTLNTEGFGISGFVYQEMSAIDAIGKILDTIDAALYQDPQTGKLGLKLVRADYSVASLPLYDESNIDIESIGWNVSTWNELHNAVIVRYEDPAGNYDIRVTGEQDMAAMLRQGGKRRPFVVTYDWIKSRTTAKRVAYRELAARSRPLAKLTFYANRDAVDVKQGDVIKISYAEHSLSERVFRVEEYDTGTLDDDRIRVVCTEDKFDVAHDTFDPSAPDLPLHPQPAAMTTNAVMEAPRWINAQKFSLSRVEAPHLVALGKKPTSGTQSSVEMQSSTDSGVTFSFDDDEIPFTAYATVETEWNAYDASPLQVENLSSTDPLATATEFGIRQYGSNMIVIGTAPNEEIAVFDDWSVLSSVYTLSNSHNWRGLLDTRPRTHPVGTPVWFVRPDLIRKIGETDYAESQALQVKLLTDSLWGALPLVDADTLSLTTQNRAARPHPVDLMRVAENPGGTPGVTGSLYQNWLDYTWRRRKRDTTTIYKPSDADDAESGTVQRLEGRVTGQGAYVNPSTAWVEIQDNVDAALYTGAETGMVGHGDAELRVVAWRTLAGSLNLDSYQSPTQTYVLTRYRQLLRNPSFQQGTTGWTIDSGTPATGNTGIEGGGANNAIGGSGSTTTWKVTQRVDVSGWSPEGLVARFVYYALGISGGAGAGEATVTLRARDVSLSSLGTAGGTPVTPGVTTWTAYELAAFTLPADTHYIDVEVEGSANGAYIMVDALDLRVGDTDGQGIANNSFNTDLASWTTATGTWGRNTSTTLEGAGALECQSTGANDEIYQDVTKNTTWGSDGAETAMLQLWRHQSGTDTLKVVMEARKADETVLATVETPSDSPASGLWTREELFLELPDLTDHVRVRVVSVSNSTGNNSVLVDYPRLFMWRQLHPYHEHTVVEPTDTPEQTFPRYYEGWTDLGAPKPSRIYLMDETSGTTLTDQMNVPGVANQVDLATFGSPLLGQTFAGVRVGSSYASKTCMETVSGSQNGAQFPNVTDLSIDGTNSWSLLLPLRFFGEGASRYLAGSLSGGQGWGLRHRGDGNDRYDVTVQDDGAGSVILSSAGVDYGDGVPGYVVVQYKAGADTIGIWTHRDAATSSSLAALSSSVNLSAPRIGGIVGANAVDGQWPYAVVWTGSASDTLTKTHTDAWWQHGTDPTGALTYTIGSHVACDVDSDASGAIVSAYGTSQVAIFRSAALTASRGLSVHKGFDNLLTTEATWPGESSWSDFGGITTTVRYGVDAMRFKRSVRLQGDDTDFRTSPPATASAGDITVVFWARTNEASGHDIDVRVTTTDDIEKDRAAVTIGTTWSRVAVVGLSWDGATASCKVGIAASDSATSRDIEISGPVTIVRAAATAGEDPGVVHVRGTSGHQTSLAALDDRFIDEGEISITGTLWAGASGSAQVLANIDNGTDNKDRRYLIVHTTGQLRLWHYDNAGTPVSSDVTGPTWTSEWTVRGRWSAGGVLDDRTKYAGAVVGSGTPMYGRSSTFGVDKTLSLDSVAIGEFNDGTLPLGGLLSRIELAARERPL